MVFSKGSKILISHRRLFKEDQPRLFFGVVESYFEGIAKVSGFTWTRDPAKGFQRKSDCRTKVVALTSGSLIVYEISSEVNIEDVVIDQPDAHSVIATDGFKFQMDLSERL